MPASRNLLLCAESAQPMRGAPRHERCAWVHGCLAAGWPLSTTQRKPVTNLSTCALPCSPCRTCGCLANRDDALAGPWCASWMPSLLLLGGSRRSRPTKVAGTGPGAPSTRPAQVCFQVWFQILRGLPGSKGTLRTSYRSGFSMPYCSRLVWVPVSTDLLRLCALGDCTTAALLRRSTAHTHCPCSPLCGKH